MLVCSSILVSRGQLHVCGSLQGWGKGGWVRLNCTGGLRLFSLSLSLCHSVCARFGKVTGRWGGVNAHICMGTSKMDACCHTGVIGSCTSLWYGHWSLRLRSTIFKEWEMVERRRCSLNPISLATPGLCSTSSVIKSLKNNIIWIALFCMHNIYCMSDHPGRETSCCCSSRRASPYLIWWGNIRGCHILYLSLLRHFCDFRYLAILYK